MTATLAKAGDVGGAEETGRRLSELARVLEDSESATLAPGQKVMTLEAIAAAMTTAGLADQVGMIAMRARDEALRIPDAFQRSAALRDLASNSADWGEFDLAMAIALKFEDPSDRSWSLRKLVPILVQRGRRDQAREMARQAMEAAARISDDPTRQGALFEAVPLLARAGLSDEAQTVALGFEHPSTRWSSMYSLASILLKQGDPARARDAAIHIRAGAGELPNPVGRWDMLLSVAEILRKTGPIDQAQQTALEARRAVFQIKGHPADRVGFMGRTAAMLVQVGLDEPAGGLVESAEDLARNIEDPKSQADAWIGLIGPMYSINAVDRAKDATRSAETSAGLISDPMQRSSALMRIVQALASAGHAATARDLVSSITDPQARYNAFSSILSAEIAAGSVEPARRIVREAEDAAWRIEHPMDRSSAFSRTVESLLSLDDPDGAHRIARMVAAPPERSAALAKVAKALARKNRLRKAREVAETCDLATDRLDAFTTIVGEYTRVRKPDLAGLIDELEAPPVVPVRPVF